MSEEVDRITDWENRYKEKFTPWHSLKVHPHLLDSASRLFENRTDLRVFVPLCGKTVDMLWFYQQGHTVVGVEVIEEAAFGFFKDQDLPYEESVCSVTQAKVLKTLDGKICIFVCDFFKLDPKVFQEKFDILWDRGSLGSIRLEDREPYVDLIGRLMKPDYRMLLEAWVFAEGEEHKGPPHTLTKEMTQKLYGDPASVDVVATDDITGGEFHQLLKLKGQLLVHYMLIKPK